ncbi:uncharacterized protein [Ptychodera flava]|uniref:uncharacterized protein n=1 Tax=Ptychodera flava TaxID=63121 RepID=UPI003969DC67
MRRGNTKKSPRTVTMPTRRGRKPKRGVEGRPVVKKRVRPGAAAQERERVKVFNHAFCNLKRKLPLPRELIQKDDQGNNGSVKRGRAVAVQKRDILRLAIQYIQTLEEQLGYPKSSNEELCKRKDKSRVEDVNSDTSPRSEYSRINTQDESPDIDSQESSREVPAAIDQQVVMETNNAPAVRPLTSDESTAEREVDDGVAPSMSDFSNECGGEFQRGSREGGDNGDGDGSILRQLLIDGKCSSGSDTNVKVDHQLKNENKERIQTPFKEIPTASPRESTSENHEMEPARNERLSIPTKETYPLWVDISAFRRFYVDGTDFIGQYRLQHDEIVYRARHGLFCDFPYSLPITPPNSDPGQSHFATSFPGDNETAGSYHDGALHETPPSQLDLDLIRWCDKHPYIPDILEEYKDTAPSTVDYVSKTVDSDFPCLHTDNNVNHHWNISSYRQSAPYSNQVCSNRSTIQPVMF